MALGQRAVGLQRVLEPADSDDRQVHGPAQRGGDEQCVARRHRHGRLDHEQVGGGDADRDVDVVDLSARLHHPGQFHRLVEGGAAFDQLVAAEPDTQRHVPADGLADGGDDLAEQPRPVVQRPAVAVGPEVRRRGQERPHDRRMRALQLDAVEAALPAVPGDQRVPGDDLGDLPWGEALGDLAEQRVGNGRGRPHRHPRVHAGGLAAVVVDLGEDRGAVPVHGFGDAPVAGDDGGVEAVDELLVRPVRRMGGVLLGDDQSGAAGGPSRVVGHVLVGGEPALGEVGEVGGEDDPVLRPDRPELDRGEQVAVAAAGTHRPASSNSARADATGSVRFVPTGERCAWVRGIGRESSSMTARRASSSAS